jgi:hypothetical protein
MPFTAEEVGLLAGAIQTAILNSSQFAEKVSLIVDQKVSAELEAFSDRLTKIEENLTTLLQSQTDSVLIAGPSELLEACVQGTQGLNKALEIKKMTTGRNSTNAPKKEEILAAETVTKNETVIPKAPVRPNKPRKIVLPSDTEEGNNHE